MTIMRYGAKPEQHRKAAEKSSQELDPLWGCGRRSECVWAIPFQVGFRLGRRQTGLRVALVLLEQLLHGDLVVFDLHLLLEVVQLGPLVRVMVLVCMDRISEGDKTEDYCVSIGRRSLQ